MSELIAPAPVGLRDLAVPFAAVLLLLMFVYQVVAFDQGTLGLLLSERLADSGGVLHELFHDARHVMGVPCH